MLGLTAAAVLDPLQKKVQQKDCLISYCDDYTAPIFNGLGRDLFKAARELADAIPGEDMTTKMVDLLGALEPSDDMYSTIEPLKAILQHYTDAVGITLARANDWRQGMAMTDICFEFECLAWLQLMRQELHSSLHIRTYLYIRVDEDYVCPNVKSETSGRGSLDLTELIVVEQTMPKYWKDHRTWALLKETHSD
jgi:hypothetical protein